MADLLLFQNIALPPQRWHRTYHHDNSRFSDEGFNSRFGKDLIEFILNLISNDDLKRKTKRSHTISPLTQLLIALHFYQMAYGMIGAVSKISAFRPQGPQLDPGYVEI